MNRTTRRRLVAFITAILSASPAFSAEPLKLPPKDQFHLFLLIGQSNMAGRGAVEEQDKTPHPRVLMLNKSGEWTPARDPLHFDKPVAGTGLGKTFGIRIAEANPNITVGLIPSAVGGSPIDSWRPGEFYPPTKSHPWDDAIRRARLAMTSGVLKGILWHQGESDSTEAYAGAYESKLHDLIARLRKELGASEVPFIVGQMGQFPGQAWDKARQQVDKAHQDLPAKVPNTAFVSSAGLRHKGDNVHFDSASYRELGRRYAEAFAKFTCTSSDSLPEMRVASVRRVFHNGEHNAFTDLVRFKGKFYLTFRSCPDGHMVHPTASILILASDDAQEWRQVHRFRVEHRDTRDPHFLVFRDRLFVYTGTWYSGPTTPAPNDYDLNKHLGYAAWSEDGTAWHSPIMLEGTFGHYIWRAAAFDGKAYLCGRRKTGFAVAPRGEGKEVESLMLESDDGLIWRKRAVFQETAGDETAFLFEPDGRVLAVGRRDSNPAQLLRSSPPYREWERKDLDRYVGGPLLARWGDRYLVGGRKATKEGEPKTSLCWLVGDRLHEFAELPSGGDNSYPGFVELSPRRALVSYYSSHERDTKGKPITAIYLAELVIEQ